MRSAILLAVIPATVLAHGIWVKNPVEGEDAYWRIKHSNTIEWGADGHDNPEAFSVYLKNDNPDIDGDNLGIANNVKTADGKAEIGELPDYIKPSDGWRLEFVQVDDVNNVYTSSSDFNIKEKEAPAPPAQEGEDNDDVNEDSIESKTEDEESKTSEPNQSSGTASVMNMPTHTSSSSSSSSSSSHSIPNPTHNAPSSTDESTNQSADEDDSAANAATISTVLLGTLSLTLAVTLF